MDDFPEIPGCKVINLLGEGSVAKVYLGIQQTLNREVAIKILEPYLSKDKVTAARFEKEAKTAAKLTHSSIVQIHDTGRAGPYHYIVMEYLEESLKERMSRNPQGKIYPEVALDIVEEIMKALDYAHFRGVYHRDIKPDNIMFRQDSTPVLVDFGIARVFESLEELTQIGIFMGTPNYMSPEQCDSQPVDGRSDVYSLGVVLFEMLTGKKPYEGTGMMQVAFKHVNEPVPGLPKALRSFQPLIDKMMNKDRDRRLSCGPELTQALDKLFTTPEGRTPLPLDLSPAATAEMPTPPPSSPSKKIEFSYKKAKESLFTRYLNLADKKLRSFFKVIRGTGK